MACQEAPKPQMSSFSQHIETSQDFQSIMHKFDNLVHQHFQSELNRDEKRRFYTKEMLPLLDEMVSNTKALQNYSQKHSVEYIQFANALEDESKKLQVSIKNYRTEEIAPTLKNITNICTQCHATLH